MDPVDHSLDNSNMYRGFHFSKLFLQPVSPNLITSFPDLPQDQMAISPA